MVKYLFKGSYLTRKTIIAILLNWGYPQAHFNKYPERTSYYYEGILFLKQEFEEELAKKPIIVHD